MKTIFETLIRKLGVRSSRHKTYFPILLISSPTDATCSNAITADIIFYFIKNLLHNAYSPGIPPTFNLSGITSKFLTVITSIIVDIFHTFIIHNLQNPQ
jgi:mannitol-specific phosphotransferase system IIBC component